MAVSGIILSAVMWAVARWMIVTGLIVLLWNFHGELLAWGWGYFLALLTSIGVPDIGLPAFGAWVSTYNLLPILSAANDWLPVVEFVGAIGLYSTLLLSITPVKMLLRRTPGLNG